VTKAGFKRTRLEFRMRQQGTTLVLFSGVRFAARDVPMEQRAENGDVERSCQGISPSAESSTFPATVHCATCGGWFCDAHAEDEEWHPCMLQEKDEGGEA
jgi:hypothetical protein